MAKRRPKTKSVSVKDFTGTITRLLSGQIRMFGVGKRAKASEVKRAVKRVAKKRNVAAGFWSDDDDGRRRFHPIRASYDYSRSRAGEGAKGRAKKAKKKSTAKKRSKR